MKKALLIINPTSGGEKALDYREKLEDKAGQYFDHVETKITQKAKDATEFAKQASETAPVEEAPAAPMTEAPAENTAPVDNVENTINE